jgi:hypothetical protein
MPTRFLPDTDLLLGNFRSAGVERVTVSFQADESETFKITRTAAIDAAGAGQEDRKDRPKPDRGHA